MISVIVCTYNQEKTIGRTLDSILCQECHEPIEIVIGEDCSTDNTLAVCERYANDYPDVIRIMANKKNKGVVDNYFDCIMAARGEYIADCAGDDFWCDNKKLEKEITILENNPDVGIVHTEWQYFNEKSGGTVLPDKPVCSEKFVDGKMLLEDILAQRSRPVIHLCTSLYRSEWIRQAHDKYLHFFRNKTYRMEDVQVCFFLARMGRIAYLPDITLNYSRGEETVSWSYDELKQASFVRSSAQLTYDLATEFNLVTPKVVHHLQWRIYELMMHAFRSRNKELRHEAVMLLGQWQLSMTPRITIVRLATSCAASWGMALVLRKIFRLCRGCISFLL